MQGAPANELGRPVPPEVKEERWHRFMEAQQEVSAKRHASEGRHAPPVIIDEAGPTVAKGRSNATRPRSTAPSTSRRRRPLRAGDIVTVKIERADAYDLHGVAV